MDENRLKRCQFCREDFHSTVELNRYLVHLHLNEPDFELECPTCPSRFHNYSTLRSHISRLHKLRGDRRVDNVFEPESMDVDQQNANFENNQNAQARVGNVGNIRDEEDGMNIDREYEREEISDDVNGEDSLDKEYESEDISDDDSSEDSEEEGNNENPNLIQVNVANGEKKKSIENFLLELRATSTLSESDINSLLLNLKNVVQVHVRETLLEVDNVIADRTGIHLTDLINIEEKVNSLDCIHDLDKRRKRDQYLETEFNIVKPIRYVLGKKFIKYRGAACGGDRITKTKKDEMMYVPLTSVIK